MIGHHDLSVVALSAVFAILSAYAALDLAGRVTTSRGTERRAWLAGGAVAMGLGIWSMHYTGMLAFQLPSLSVLYRPVRVAGSLAAAIAASWLALMTVSRPHLGLIRAIVGGNLMGLGIVAMHYTGMSAMNFNGTISYDSGLVALSVIIAIIGSLLAIWIAFHLRDADVRVWPRIGGAVLMGAAICCMHYTAMGAASFSALTTTMAPAGVAVPTLGVLAMSGVVFIVLATTLLTATLQRREALVSASIAGREEARLGYEQFLRDVIDADPHMVFAKDRDGRFTLANRATATMYGTTSAALVGKTDKDLNPNAKEVEHFQKDDRYVIDTGKPKSVPEERVTNAKTGETRWFQTIKVPLLAADGKTHHVLGVATDITERKLLEAQLRQAQKMEAVGRLAGGVAHDFNNLLTAIIGHTDMLLDGNEGMPKHVREDVSEIKKSAQRAAALTRQLLAFSRKQVLEPRVIDLNALVVNINALLRRLIGEHIELHTTQDPKLKTIEADPGQLEQVIMNLAVNARDAMPNGGKLVIETSNVTLGPDATRERPAMPAGRYVMLAISDNGIGMDAEVQSHLFEPFFTTKKPGEGTGLGLATVYGIIKQSGGFVWVYSEPGIGTTFKLYFPPVDAAVPEPEAAPAPLPPSSAETILVVEDEDAVRRVTSRVLAKRGYTILEATSGDDALRVAREYKGHISLLLTDVVMPRMSGRELANVLEKERPDMKVLYVSGYTDDAIVHHGILEAGVIFLQKPFSPDVLARKVADTLSKS